MAKAASKQTIEKLSEEFNEATKKSLRYADMDQAGIARERQGDGFRYRDATGKLIRDKRTLARIAKIAIPPAWEKVWIAPDADTHVQATGRDARGRKQYRYHEAWTSQQAETKYDQLAAFGAVLPKMRRAIEKDLSRPGLDRRRVLALLTTLLDRTGARVGNDSYAKENKSYGLTTLQDRHLEVAGSAVTLSFVGKGGKEQKVNLMDGRLARAAQRCSDVPGRRLFQYLDEEGDRHGVDSGDVNDYIREISGAELTAKHFRTWVASVEAFRVCISSDEAEENAACVKAAVAAAAERLGNTPAIARSSYIHPMVLQRPSAPKPKGRRPLELDEVEHAFLSLIA